jgi:hypothetical protein
MLIQFYRIRELLSVIFKVNTSVAYITTQIHYMSHGSLLLKC